MTVATAPRLITPEEVADILGVTTQTLREWDADPNNTFPRPIKPGPRTFRYFADDIEQWLADQRAHRWVNRLVTEGESTESRK